MDVKLVLDELAQNARPLMAALLIFAVMTMLLRSQLARRLGAMIEKTFFDNWQLGLLATTGLVLSVAAGWRTWEGMYNFTGEPLLSGMITFGIQGIMLIVAWLIGESFATGMSMQSQRGESRLVNPQVQNWIGAGIGLMLAIAGFVLFMQWSGQADVRNASAESLSWSHTGDKFLMFGTGLLLVALFALYAASDIVKPYLQGARIIIRNSMLWVMFLACMMTSVFFSFDSFFTAIFPQSERVRAAELRAQNQVAGIVADIEGVIAERNASEAGALLQGEAWTQYEGTLSRIAKVASSSQGALERYINTQIEDRRRAVKEQQERMASAQSGQSGLAGKKISLTEEKGRLSADRPALAADYAEKKADLDAKAKEIDAKRVEALAEDKGVEGTGKQGRGPMYRQRMSELALLQNAYKVAEERAKDSQKRLTAAESRLAAIDRELATIDGDLAKLKGEAETAEQRIALASETAKEDVGQRMDPSRLVPSFERAIAEFRERPSSERLAAVHGLCGDIYGALQATPETKTQISGLDCDPKRTSDASSNLFALQAGTKIFAANCSGGEKIAANKSTDELFSFARRCLQDSALPSADTDALRTKINHIELSRDDKAHRFVVTWNAFQDGNRLAYLALAIAVGLDALIFMSGLFGANAVRSPLSDVPTFKARSGQQLESTINAALGPHPYDTAWMTLNALRPMTYEDGFSAMCDLSVLDKPTADRIRMVLTAGADIGAVETVSHNPERYRVRSELREYLSSVCDKHFKTNAGAKEKARLAQLVGAALEPFPREHADLVLHSLEPIRETDGFTSRVILSEFNSETKKIEKMLDPYEERVVRRVMNAGATVKAVAPDLKIDDCFYIRPDLYETLLTIRATSLENHAYEFERRRHLGLPQQQAQPGAIDAGVLRAQTTDITQEQHEQIEAPRRQLPKQVPLSEVEVLTLTEHFRQTLLQAIGLNTELVDDRLMQPAAKKAMAQVWKSLQTVGRSNPNLATYLDAYKKAQENALTAASAKLSEDIEGDGRKAALLYSVEGRIAEDLVLYILFPESGMITYLIEELEKAAQPDDGLRHEEHFLMEQLKYVRDGLNELNLNLPTSWDEINQRLAPRQHRDDFFGRFAPPRRGSGDDQS